MYEIPFWLMLLFGGIETFSVIFFICTMSGLNLDKLKIFLIVATKLFFIIGFREIVSDIVLISSFSVFSSIFFIWLFAKTVNINIIIYSIISILILMTVSSVSIIIGTTYFNYIHFYVLWTATGLPHVILMLLVSFIYKKMGVRYGAVKF